MSLSLNRRAVLKSGAAATAMVAASQLGLGGKVFAQDADKVYKVALIGCGGRGTQATANHLDAARNLGVNVKLVAMADAFEHRLTQAYNSLVAIDATVVDVPAERKFVGIDAYHELCKLEDVDIVINATPPGLRPYTFRAAIENGKHCFIEKPVCTDAWGYRHILETEAMATEKGLSVTDGRQYRVEPTYMAAITAMREGIIGDILGVESYYQAGSIWYRSREELEAKLGRPATDIENCMNNWFHTLWLCGDSISEQAIHMVDAMFWGLDEWPQVAYGNGGRRARPADSELLDSFAVNYRFANQSGRALHMSRQHPGDGGGEVFFQGTTGTLTVWPGPGNTRWMARDLKNNVLVNCNGRQTPAGEPNVNPYVREHEILLNAIVKGERVSTAADVAISSLACLAGREAVYSGKRVKMNEYAEAKQKLSPEGNMFAEAVTPEHTLPVPGQYKIDNY